MGSALTRPQQPPAEISVPFSISARTMPSASDSRPDNATDVNLPTVRSPTTSSAPLRGFPVLLSELLIVLEREGDRLVSSPVVADLDRDGLKIDAGLVISPQRADRDDHE